MNVVSVDTSKKKFEELCARHDWYYNRSDDHRKWLKGFEDKQKIYAVLNIVSYEQEYVDIFNNYAPSELVLKPATLDTLRMKPKHKTNTNSER